MHIIFSDYNWLRGFVVAWFQKYKLPQRPWSLHVEGINLLALIINDWKYINQLEFGID